MLTEELLHTLYRIPLAVAQVPVTGPEDPKANAHSPNESISLPALKNNVITEALLLDKLAK